MPFYEQLLSLDRSLFLLLNTAIANPVFDIIFVNANEAKVWIIPGIIAAAFFIFKKRKEALVVLGLAIATVAITDPLATRVLKPLFHRARPCHPDLFVEGGRFLAGMRHTFSFPSVHAVNIFAQATLFAFFYPRWTWVYALFACCIGYARVYVGVHYPADVAAGAVVGILAGAGVAVAYREVRRRVEKRRAGGGRGGGIQESEDRRNNN
ncbi:MAG: phosphatase PAP2 family protein [Chitinispirillaceae bacterium]|nr:phosphatase PAP2 family protein [Chitinispirillaceae bacterium]